MKRTPSLVMASLISFIFTLSGYSQYLERMVQEPNEKLYEIMKAERQAAQNRMMQKTNQNTNNYDVKYYRLEWLVDPASNPASISGNITSYWEAIEPMKTITFDLAENMRVSQIQQRSNDLTFTHTGDELIITLPVTQAVGSLDSLTITYDGNPSGSSFGSFGSSFNQDSHNSIPILWTESVIGAKEWWPCKQCLKDRADSIDILVTHPQFFDGFHEYKTASCGVLISETIQEQNKTTHWKHRYPIPVSLIDIAVTNYSVYYDYAYAGTDHEIPIINYVFPEHLLDVQTYTPITATIMELYGDLFEMFPYSDEKYGHAEIIADYGLEHPTISFMGFFNHREIIAHELAHEWFSGKVINGSWEDIWLIEAFATYLDALTTEHLDGKEAFTAWRRKMVNDVTAKSDGSVRCTDTTSVMRIFDYRLTFKKSSMVLHMLRYKMGDTDFYSAVKNYLADPDLAYNYALTIDLQKHFETQSDLDLDEFFADWYLGEGHPSYQLQWDQSGDSIYFIVNQSQSHSSVSFFEMVLPVKVNGRDGETLWLQLENTEDGQFFIKNVGFPVFSVQLDPEYELITHNNSVSYSPFITGIRDEQNRNNDMKLVPNPVNNILKIKTSISGKHDLKITSLNGKLLLNTDIEGNTHQLDLSFLQKGVYLITIRSKEFVTTKKIIKL